MPINGIAAQPYQWPDASTIPTLRWLFGRFILGGAVTVLASPGGLGKTSWLSAAALSMASGRAFMGVPLYEGAQRVWLWGLEDDLDQLARGLAANAIRHGVSEVECADRLHVTSALGGMGMDPVSLCTAVQGQSGCELAEGVFSAIENTIMAKELNVLMIDPFISSHLIPEFDNGAMDANMKRWGLLAKRTGCAIVFSHHTRKTNGEVNDVESVQGASAITNAARVVLLLNRMNANEAAALGVNEETERLRTFSLSMGKSNRAAPMDASWYRLEGVSLGNGGDRPSDEVGAVVRWSPPDALADVTLLHLVEVQTALGGGQWRADPRAKDWVGHLVAPIVGFDPDQKSGRARIRQLLERWQDEGFLRTDRRIDPATRKVREFVVIGRIARAGGDAPDGDIDYPADWQ